MTSTFIASSAVSGALRSSLMKLQAKLAEAQKEVATGRLADVGLSLGFKAGQTVSLRPAACNRSPIPTGSSPRAWMRARLP